MKPLWMSIEGLNSFIEEQTINFQELIQKGLFGIFGPTGCGKSTILDGMTLALYGKIARGNTDFINTNCEKVHIVYDFEVYRNGQISKYRVERNIKRDKKDRNKYLSTLVRLIDITNESNMIITDKKRETDDKIEKILGLNFNEFTRSVVLPQGKFSEFIKLKPSDRNKMLEKLFGLEEYGEKLTYKVKHRKKIIYEKILVINTKIEEHGKIDKSQVNKLSKELSELEDKQKSLKIRKVKLDEKYEENKKIFELQKELEEYKLNFNILMSQKAQINNDKIKLENAKTALECYPYIKRIKTLEKDINDNENKLIGINKVLNEKKEAYIQLNADYEQIYSRKNCEIPKLIKKKQLCVQGIELISKINILSEEISKAREEYKKQYKTYHLLTEQQNEYSQNKEKVSESIKQVMQRKIAIEILPDIREKAFEGKDIELYYKKNKKLLNEIDIKVNSLQNKIETKQKEYLSQINIEKDLNDNINLLNLKLNSLKSNEPFSENEINSFIIEREKLNQLIEQYNNKKNDKLTILNNIKELQNEYNHLCEQYEIIENDYNQQYACTVELDKNYNSLNDKNIAYILYEKLEDDEPCPVCGSIHHKKLKYSVDTDKIKTLKIELTKCQNIIEQLKTERNKLEIKKSTISNTIESLNKELNLLDKDLTKINITESTDKKEILDSNLKTYKNTRKIWNDNVENINIKLLDFKNLDVKNKIKIATDLQEIENLKVNLEELNKQKDELEIELKQQSKNYNQFKEILKVNNILEFTKQIIENDKEIKLLNKKETELRDQVNIIDEKMNSLFNNLTINNQEIGKTKQIGIELKKQLDECKNNLTAICENKNPENMIEIIDSEIKYINDSELSIKTRLKTLEEHISSMKDKQVILQEKNKNNIKQKSIEETTLKRLCEKYKFEVINQVEEALLSNEEIIKIETKVKKYENDYIKVTSYVTNIKNKLKGRSIEKNTWNKLIELRQENIIKLEETTEELVTKTKSYEDLKTHLKEIEKLDKQLVKLRNTMDLILEIEKLIKGGAFIKYIGTKKLSYIAKDATNMLSYITNGSYCLELSENGSFIICDNSNGGQRRSTDSLSGGELFLTSLSLAIALSSQIQMERNSNLEFFFLDEGFGTLDSYLLDVVMNALEKLNRHKLSIGIISHVDELKNRVPAQLVLQPANNGFGTKVKELIY